MEVQSILKAGRRLEAARRQLESARNVENYEDFEQAWYFFLVAAKSVQKLLQKGSRSDPRSRQWFGGKITDRKANPFLQYFYQARDDDEHGLGRVTGPWGMTIVPGENATLEMRNGVLGHRMVIPHDTPMRTFGILQAVEGRGGRIYPPPSDSELGCPRREEAPIKAGERLIGYLETLLEEAAERAV